MNSVQIEDNVKSLLQNFSSHQVSKDNFVYELLLAYGHRKSVVSRVKSGERNLSKTIGEVILKRHLYFKPCSTNLFAEIDVLKNSKTVTVNKIRFVIVTDFNQLIAVDTKTQDTLDIELNQLPKHFDFFLPWAGTEKMVYRGENPADVKAAEKMADLFDLIKELNYPANPDKAQLHELVVFLNRLLFCFFAEDTQIFEQNQFTNLISLHTQEDGSDLSSSLQRLFEVLNTAAHQRSDLPQYLQSFPYVNGGLFKSDSKVPIFNAKARRMLLDSGTLDWADINPDIFGSMIQGVADANTRSTMGMHYTSVTNIMKVIEPLFLNDFYDEFDKCKGSINKLRKLQVRLCRIKIFDPACGSGNFLIIAYKEIRQLEIEILKRIQELELTSQSGMVGLFDESHSAISLAQFYGIELDDFAHEMAVLSLWLVEHQMNMVFETEFGYTAPTLPLKQGGRIIAGNAVRSDWNAVCPIGESDECYVLGNPPYKGARKQTVDQKKDLEMIFRGSADFKDSDYVICWLKKASHFMAGNNVKFAFVTTDSICQGEQVAYAWESIYQRNQEIFFAYESFDWKNNAKDSAGVSCVIVGVCNSGEKIEKVIYNDISRKKAVGISPYIKESKDVVFLRKRNKPISKVFPKMVSGSMARDDGNLFLTKKEMETIVKDYSEAADIIRSVYGTSEFVSGKERFCIWIDNEKKLELARTIPAIKERINAVKAFRESSSAKTTQGYASIPHMFAQRAHIDATHIIIPKVSTDRREYMPLGFMPEDAIVTDLAFGIYNADLFTFGMLSSKMHNLWHKTISGRLGKGPRYSSNITYNNFPIPSFSMEQKEQIENAAMEILAVREKFSEQPIASLYDPELMPDSLRNAHNSLDNLVDNLYSKTVIAFEYERRDILFKIYNDMVNSNA